MLCSNDFDRRSDYFSIVPPSYCIYSAETPFASPAVSPADTLQSPCHPLLAYRGEALAQTYDSVTTRMSSLMARQTSAAHGYSSNRPRPCPVQNVLHVTSDDASSSEGSSSSKSSLDVQVSLPEIARCSRCQRTPSVDVKTGKSNMVQYGLNLWYCSRCAAMVGLIKR